jgi:hypothetical protein
MQTLKQMKDICLKVNTEQPLPTVLFAVSKKIFALPDLRPTSHQNLSFFGRPCGRLSLKFLFSPCYCISLASQADPKKTEK